MGIDPLQVILFLLGFGSILFLAYVTTRYLAGKTNKAMRGKYIQIVETVNLGLDKRLHLVRAGDQYVLVASTSKRIEFLTVVDIGDEAPDTAEDAAVKNVFDFKTIIDKYLNVYRDKKSSALQQERKENQEDPEGYISFRNNLGKLKSILQKDRQVGENDDESTNEK